MAKVPTPRSTPKSPAAPTRSPQTAKTAAKADAKPSARSGARPGPRAGARAAEAPAVPAKRAPAQKPYHHGNLREALIASGKAQLEKVGLADISLRQIAAEVGVSQVAPKHHFGNKEGLLAAIAANGFEDLANHRGTRLKTGDKPEQRLRALLSAYVAFAGQYPALFSLMFSGQFRSPAEHAALAEASGQAYRALRDAMADYMASLKAKPSTDGLSVDEAARAAWTSMHGIALLAMDGQVGPKGAARVSKERLVARTLDIFFAGVRRVGVR